MPACMAFSGTATPRPTSCCWSVSMFCPLVSVLLVQKFWLHQPTGIGWKVQGKRRFWLAAWFGPAVFTVLGSGAVLCGVPVPAGHLRQLAG